MSAILALIAEVDGLPDPNKNLLTHNERELIEFCQRLAVPLRTMTGLIEALKQARAIIYTGVTMSGSDEAAGNNAVAFINAAIAKAEGGAA